MTDAVILLVDDEAGFIEALAKRLSKRNMEVHKACDGESALQRLDSRPGIDVVVLDMKMPVRDGLSVLKDIRREHALVEVIMLTGYATVESAIEGMRSGAYDYLMKPCDLEELTSRIQAAVSRKRRLERQASELRIHGIACSRV